LSDKPLGLHGLHRSGLETPPLTWQAYGVQRIQTALLPKRGIERLPENERNHSDHLLKVALGDRDAEGRVSR
jgi:hypothetical protein